MILGGGFAIGMGLRLDNGLRVIGYIMGWINRDMKCNNSNINKTLIKIIIILILINDNNN